MLESAPPLDRARLKVGIILDTRIRYGVLVVSFAGRKNMSRSAPPPDWARLQVNILPDTCIQYIVLVISLAGRNNLSRSAPPPDKARLKERRMIEARIPLTGHAPR